MTAQHTTQQHKPQHPQRISQLIRRRGYTQQPTPEAAVNGRLALSEARFDIRFQVFSKLSLLGLLSLFIRKHYSLSAYDFEIFARPCLSVAVVLCAPATSNKHHKLLLLLFIGFSHFVAANVPSPTCAVPRSFPSSQAADQEPCQGDFIKQQRESCELLPCET
jgi:hypothetical protein